MSLVLYQIETVSVPIVDNSMKADSYTHPQVSKPYIAINTEMYITIRTQNMQENRLWILL